MALKTGKNLASPRTEYSACYDGMRGVDFTTNHSQVSNNRFAYLVNMYRNYRADGLATETIPGYDKTPFGEKNVCGNGAAIITEGSKCKALYTLKSKEGHNVFFLHIDNYIYGIAEIDKDETVQYDDYKVELSRGEKKKYFDCWKDRAYAGQDAQINTAFCVNDRLYYLTNNRIDGVYYHKDLKDDGKTLFNKFSELNVGDYQNPIYIPTTYINLPPSGWQQDENNAYGAEYEQRNLLTDEFKVTFIADGKSTKFYLPESADDLSFVSAYFYADVYQKTEGAKPTTEKIFLHEIGCGTIGSQDNDKIEVSPVFYDDGKFIYYFDNILTLEEKEKITIQTEDGRAYIELMLALNKNTTDGITIVTKTPLLKNTEITVTLSKRIKGVKGASDANDAKNLVLGCTKSCIFDNRVFLTGNPKCPNHIFWSGFNAQTGMIEPTYFGILDNMYDGITSKITGIMAVSDTLVVLKEDNSEGTMYFHQPQATGEDLQPKVYPSSRGMSSAGCSGACINFLDDPVFISRLGLEGIDHMSAGMERIVGHRSSNVDAQLLKHDLTKARLAEWQGYLLLLVDGYLFMADSRQKFQHHTGSVQYEWYYIERLGEWVDSHYVYADALPEGMSDFSVHPDAGKYVPDDVKIIAKDSGFYYTEEDNESYLVYPAEKFYPATEIVSTGDNIYFATSRGNLMMFNFDLMDENGELPTSAYSFAGLTIKSGVAFKMDNVGIPHLTKSTIKKSTVIKMKPMRRSGAKVKIRTNRDPYHELNSINSARFDFNDIDFGDFTFLDGEQSLFVVHEKEKKWVEKQYYIYSDEYCRPFALYSLAFRYYVAGRYKEK